MCLRASVFIILSLTLSLYIYIYTHTHTHTHTYLYIHIYTHAFTYNLIFCQHQLFLHPTGKDQVHPRTGHKGSEGSRSITYSFFNFGIRLRWVVNATPRPLYPRTRNLVPTVQEAGWARGPIRTGVENLDP
jgi:hypothetical protein